MKKILLVCTLPFIFLANAQDNNDILLGVHIPDQAENIPSSAKNLLYSRVFRLITDNGVSADEFNPRFFVAPKIAVLEKEVLGTAPPRVVLNLELTLFIGDGVNGNLIESETVELKGVGQNEQKAYINAIKRLAPKNPALVALLAKAKTEIVAYYNEHCSSVIKAAKSLRDQDNTFAALDIIANIPVSTSCYDENSGMIKDYYQKAIDEECKRLLNAARSHWYATQTVDGANAAGEFLMAIEPRAYCYDEVEIFHKEIATRVKELSNKEWDLTLRVVDARIEAASFSRDILLEYVKNQPKRAIFYRMKDWY
ncbi:MAG: hypothetical protein ABJN84_08975 [Flavobacteriaceae bacterium]